MKTIVSKEEYEALKLMKEGVDYHLVKKEDSRLMRVCAWFAKPFCPRFMTGYVSTFGRTIYAPGGRIGRETLMHELVHISDLTKYHVWFSLSYYLLLPVVWTMRSRWEMRSYSVSIRMLRASGTKKSWLWESHTLPNFTGPAYLWMWPWEKSLAKWFDAVWAEPEIR